MFFIIVLSLTQSQCLQPVCQDTSSSICYDISENNKFIQIHQCTDDKTCSANNSHIHEPLNQSFGQVCRSDIVEQRYPGEHCSSDVDCLSSLCTKGICLGKQLGQGCQNVFDCDIGLVCNKEQSGICVIAKNIGEDCNHQLQCINSAGCFNGICTSYFSLEVGSQFSLFKAGTDPFLCESGYYDADFICQNAPKNKKKPYEECKDNKDCKLSDEKSGSCSCGLNSSGKAFCRAFKGDDEFLNYKQSLLNVLRINQNCHPAIKYSNRCPILENTSEIQDLQKNYYLYLYRHLIIDSPSCAWNMINPYAKDYRYLKSPDNNDEEDLEWMLTIIGVVIGSVLLCSLVVLVFMRKCMVHRLWYQQEQDEALPISSTQLAFTQEGSFTSKFDFQDFEMDLEQVEILLKGIPIGQLADTNTLEIRDYDEYPLAQEDEQKLDQTQNIDNN